MRCLRSSGSVGGLNAFTRGDRSGTLGRSMTTNPRTPVFGAALLCAAASAAAPGTATATPWHESASGRDGPTVMIVGGMHGNEPAGAAAADQIRHWPVTRGRIVVVPRANAPALAANTRTLPAEEGAERCDLNRAFPPDGGAAHPGDRLARSLWALVRETRPDWLIDLHESVGFRVRNERRVGNSVIRSGSADARRMGDRMVEALNAALGDPERRFVPLYQPARGSLARAAAEGLGVRSLIVETTTKAGPQALRARQHRIAVRTALLELGMIDPARVTPELMTPEPAQAPPGAPIRVALYDGAGNGGAGLAKVAARLGAGTGFAPVRVCPEDIRAGALRRFDAVIFTGGSGSAQGKALGKDGRAEVRRAVERGGGYVGICAGAYLACRGFPTWGLGIIDAKTLSPEWRRGRAVVKLELTGAGRALFDEPPGRFDCLYHQGPIVGPAQAPELADYEPLALFRTEVAKNGTPEGIMVNAPAIFAGTCGQGRVVCFSPHPEQTDGLDDLVPRAVLWAAGRTRPGVSALRPPRGRPGAGKDANMTFICTHNSRRSRMSQTWAQSAARDHALDRVHAFPGGTEATACKCRTVAAMRTAGFPVVGANDGDRPASPMIFPPPGPPPARVTGRPAPVCSQPCRKEDSLQ